MGGCVNVFLRDKDRNFHQMTRWTNILPSFLDCIGNVEDEDEHLQEYMETWFEMKEDWEKNRQTADFEHPMTSMYFPSPTKICQSEYGLVFVDYITKTIVSYQDYTSIGIVSIAAIMVSYDNDERDRILKIADAGRISYQPFTLDISSRRKVEDTAHMEQLIKDREGDLPQFIVDNSPWNIIDCDKCVRFTKIKSGINQILAK